MGLPSLSPEDRAEPTLKVNESLWQLVYVSGVLIPSYTGLYITAGFLGIVTSATTTTAPAAITAALAHGDNNVVRMRILAVINGESKDITSLSATGAVLVASEIENTWSPSVLKARRPLSPANKTAGFPRNATDGDDVEQRKCIKIENL